jgi:hypothetical protein
MLNLLFRRTVEQDEQQRGLPDRVSLRYLSSHDPRRFEELVLLKHIVLSLRSRLIADACGTPTRVACRLESPLRSRSEHLLLNREDLKRSKGSRVSDSHPFAGSEQLELSAYS